MISQTKEIEAIIQEIRARAEKEANEIIEEAKRKAEAILKEAEEKAEKIFQHESRSRLMIIKRRIIGQAEYEGRRKIIEAKNEVANLVLEKAMKEIEEIVKEKNPNVNYKEILYQLIREAVVAISEPKVIVKANNKDQKYLMENIKNIQQRIKQETGLDTQIEVDPKPVDILGGIIVATPDGLKTFHNTMEGRLKAKFDKFKKQMAKILFK